MTEPPSIDLGKCVECEACLELCPEVFKRSEAGYIEVAALEVYPEECIREAMKYCRSDCIFWEEPEQERRGLVVPKGRGTGLRSRVEVLLRIGDVRAHLPEWSRFPSRQVINPLLSFLYSGEDLVKWRAVSAIGVVMARMGEEDMEAAREIMRRLIWNLNDESGGIGWGSPEAMGEIMALHEKLAQEYAHLLVSYIKPDGNPLEHALLERGVLWGLGRLAQERPLLLQEAAPYFFPYLKSKDPFHRGLAAWALGFLKANVSRTALEPLLDDPIPIQVFENGRLNEIRIRDLAERALRATPVRS